MIEVIGISGKAGSGKDYLGRMVLRRAGYHQWAFAWPLKTQLVGRGTSYDDVFEHKPESVRHALQIIGTEEGRDRYGKDYWTRQAGSWLRILHENLGISRFYFTDVRFPNEVDFVREFGGKVIRLEHGDRIYPLQDSPSAKHSSETALDSWLPWDLVFENNLNMTPLHFRVALEEKGILPRWSDELEAPGASADRMDARFGTFFNELLMPKEDRHG